MKSFVVGTVLEPDLMATKDGKEFVNFGVLAGKELIKLDVWTDDPLYSKVSSLKDGDPKILIIRCSVDNRGYLKYYLSNIADAPEGLRVTLLSLFLPAVVEVPSIESKVGDATPQPGQGKK